MNLFARARSWFRSVTHPLQLQRDMDDELSFHIDSYVEDLVRKGVSLAEAKRSARLEFGSADAQKEQMRVALGLRFWDELRSDLSYGLRMLRKSPSFTAIAVLSLTLGIGVNTTIFTMAKQLMFDRLPVPHPEDLRLLNWISDKKSAVHSLWGDWDKTGGSVTSTSFSYPVYQYLRAHNHGLKDLFAFKNLGRLNVTVNDSADVVQGEMVSGNYYEQLQVQPQLGRAIQDYDDRIGASPVAVISDAFWTRSFGRSPSVVGKTIRLNLAEVTIIGVNPRGFTGAKSVQLAESPDVFIPFSTQPLIIPRARDGVLLTSTKLWWMQIMARTKPGVKDSVAASELDVALKDAVRETMHPKAEEALPNLRTGDGSRGMNETGRMFAQPMYVLMALVGFVLLLACANIANLLLARASVRQREMSVRIALGASRGRVLRQVFTESLLLSLFGGMGGLLFGYLGCRAIPGLMFHAWEAPAQITTSFDLRVFAFNFGLALLTGLLFGLAPAWQATRAEVNSALKDNAQTATRRRRGFTAKAIVAFQVALSTLLVLGAGVFLRTLVNLNNVNPGFDTNDIVMFNLRPPESRYPAGKDLVLYRDLQARLAAVPGVERVAGSDVALLSNMTSNDDFVPTGHKPSTEKEETALEVGATDDFFRVYGIPILEGRAFNASDTETSLKVAVVNQSLAKHFFPGEDPVGKTFQTSDGKEGKLVYEIVGVCADTRYADLRTAPQPVFYRSYRQTPDLSWGLSFEIKTHVPRATITPSLRAAVQSLDHDLPLTDIRTQREQMEALLQTERIFATLTAGFGILALILACIGIYGIMSYTVARRTNEIGIRLVLGAKTQQVLTMVLGEASWLSLAGVVVGLTGGLLLIRFIRSMLYGLRDYDPISIVGSVLLLMAVALLAGYLPARRASRVQPMQALRHE